MEEFPIWLKLIIWGILGSVVLYVIAAIVRSLLF
jgi:hypothetical protein